MLRFSIARMMAIVGVIALNIATARILFAYEPELLIGVGLGVLVLQVGLFRLVRGRGTNRAFWVGFIVCGLITMTTLVWAMLFPEVVGLSSTGVLERVPGSTMWTIWYGYARFVSEPILVPMITYSGIDPDVSNLGGILIAGARAVIWFLPQLLIAVAGGLLAGLIWVMECRNRSQVTRFAGECS